MPYLLSTTLTCGIHDGLSGDGTSAALRHTERETICIGNGVRVVILEIKRDQVRIGIEAPDSVPVHRKEIYDKIQAEG